MHLRNKGTKTREWGEEERNRMRVREGTLFFPFPLSLSPSLLSLSQLALYYRGKSLRNTCQSCHVFMRSILIPFRDPEEKGKTWVCSGHAQIKWTTEGTERRKSIKGAEMWQREGRKQQKQKKKSELSDGPKPSCCVTSIQGFNRKWDSQHEILNPYESALLPYSLIH